VDLHHLLLAGLPAHLCENAKTLNPDRTSYSFMADLRVHSAGLFIFETELKNIILAALRVFEFSHSLGPSETCRPLSKMSALRGNSEDICSH
jgi:hypothetical protein